MTTTIKPKQVTKGLLQESTLRQHCRAGNIRNVPIALKYGSDVGEAVLTVAGFVFRIQNNVETETLNSQSIKK